MFRSGASTSTNLHGIVEGSLDNVENEESFLCKRLFRETSLKRHDKSPMKWITYNNRVPSVIQGSKRPVCGLVAMCMAGHMLAKYDDNVKVYQYDDEILAVAKNMGLTRQGEMFSVKEYAYLACRVLNCESRIHTRTLASSWMDILNHIASGYPVLVPYDSDRNYEPCMKKGHKAHWALLTGFVIGIENGWSVTDQNVTIRKLSHNKELSGILYDSTNKNTEQHLLYVYAKQGKSARQQLWSLKDLSESNGNLMEVSPDRDPSQYRIPPEGISEALCSKCVLLFPKCHDK